jgi:multiple sugar transport system permease protein
MVNPTRIFRKTWQFRGLKRNSPWLYVIAAVTVVISFFPIVWLLFTSLKPAADIYAWPPVYIPNPFTLKNYIWIITETPELLRYILNSFIVASATTLCILGFGGLGAYSLTRLRYTGRHATMLGMLAVSMFPPIALLPAMFLTFMKLGLLNRYPSLVIAHTGLYMPMAIWIMSNYFKTIPMDLEDAARVDGCSVLRIFWNVILPLSIPGLISTGLIVFIFSWNEFPLSLVLLTKNSMRTAPVGISLYPGEFAFPWETISTATFLAIIPILVITAIFQHHIIGGLTAGSNK